MKIKRIALFLTIAICMAGTAKAAAPQLKTQADSISYAWGQFTASNIKSSGFELNVQAFVAAFDGMKNDKYLLTEEQQQQLLQSLQSIMQQKQAAEMAKQAEPNKAEGKKFLDENKKKAGIKTTASGLQYEVVKEGTGKQPQATSKVTVHYTGKLLNGKVFDSSVQRGEPIEFQLNAVIAGWTEGLQLMKEGGKSILYIPSDLAYGDRAMGQDIPAGSTLIFEVELLKVTD